jgi:hypothetical protein
MLPYLNLGIAIDECRIAFPDCLAFLSDNGSRIRIEFELHSSNFRSHGHDADQCDMIVCWKHDWEGCPIESVLELSSEMNRLPSRVILNPRPKYGKTCWNAESFFRESDAEAEPFLRNIYEFVKQKPSLSIEFGKGPKIASFTVKFIAPSAPRTAALGVHSNGKVWPYFDEKCPEPLMLGYRDRLASISRIRVDAERKKWFEFRLQNEKELAVLKECLEWLASYVWE